MCPNFSLPVEPVTKSDFRTSLDLTDAEFEALKTERRVRKPNIGSRQAVRAAEGGPQKPAGRSQYRSKTEEDFAKSGYLHVAGCVGISIAEILEIKYEALRFYLPGGSYKIDFSIVTPDVLLLVEVKGSRRQKNYRDSRSKLRAAADIWGQFFRFRFFQAMKVQGRWEVEEIGKKK